MALEEEFEVEIPTEDLENIKTIGDVESYSSESPVIWKFCIQALTVYINNKPECQEI